MARKRAGQNLPTKDNIPQAIKPTLKAGRDLKLVDNIPQVGTDYPTAGADIAAALWGSIRYTVTRPISQLSHGDRVYPVEGGKVDLPTGETWYQPLIENGTLKGE